MAYSAKNASGGTTKFASVTNADGEEEVKHRVTSSVLPAGAATEATIALLLARIDGPSTALYTAQDTTVGTTAAALGGSQACREIIVYADAANSADILIGNSTNQYIPLAPGDTLIYAVANVNILYRKAASGTQTIAWLARS